MQLDTITMPKDEAAERLMAYRNALARMDDPIYESIARGLRWLKRDDVLGLLDIRAAITAGGNHEPNGFPRLAVCQADAEWCWARRWGNGAVWFANRPFRNMAHNAKRGVERFPQGTLPMVSGRWREDAKTMVPIVPPELLPTTHLRNYHILWEVDEWEYTEPPGDPALLKHIGGDLYAVLGMWDLTELERAVLAGHRRE